MLCYYYYAMEHKETTSLLKRFEHCTDMNTNQSHALETNRITQHEPKILLISSSKVLCQEQHLTFFNFSEFKYKTDLNKNDPKETIYIWCPIYGTKSNIRNQQI